MFFREPEQQEDGMGREGREYWLEQLSEYWDSGLTIPEYSDLKELSYESARHWIRDDAKKMNPPPNMGEEGIPISLSA